MRNRRGILYAAGVIAFLVPLSAWFVSSFGPNAAQPIAVPVEQQINPDAQSAGKLADLADRDPMALVRMGRALYEESIDAYSFTFVKQERLDGKLKPAQEIEVRYREEPRSTYMLWKKNADQVKRALYVDDASFVNDKGEKLAQVEPAGAIARLFVSDIMMPIHGARAKKASRRSIDECGFVETLTLLEDYNRLAAERGVLNLRYAGAGSVDGRPTFVIVRDLPYEGPDGDFPDARMILHLDQEWLLPVAVYSYADHEEDELLGSYVFTNVNLHPAFDEQAFSF